MQGSSAYHQTAGSTRLAVLAQETAMIVRSSSPNGKHSRANQELTIAVWQRAEFWWSPSISRSLDAAIEVSGLEKEEIDLYDFYS